MSSASPALIENFKQITTGRHDGDWCEELLTRLKFMSKRDNRSISSLTETMLMRALDRYEAAITPNKTTLEEIREARINIEGDGRI